jgi:hypothetical protein
MSNRPDQQDQQDEQYQQDHRLEPQQHGGRELLRQVFVQTLYLFLELLNRAILDLHARRIRTPYHTSILSGEGWVQELLNGHPRRIRNELGVNRGTFTLLRKAIQLLDIHSSRHVSIEEQLAIFLYTAVTGLSSTHVGERFQRSPSTITK